MFKIGPMTHRNNHPQTFPAMSIDLAEPLRVAYGIPPVALYALVLVVLITVLSSAGFGYV